MRRSSWTEAATSGPEARLPATYGTIVVVGGGCYGGYYVRQLGRAARAGAIAWRRLLVVDRDAGCAVARAMPDGEDAWRGLVRPEVVADDWTSFFDRFLGEAAREPAAADRDAVVPSPLMPHLLFDWLLRRATARWPRRSVRAEPLRRPPDTPWQRAAPDGTHFVSFAEWMCPINCVEPARCPATRGTRDWSMPVALRRYADAERAAGHALAGPAVFHCTHRAYGVGMVDVGEVLRADDAVLRLGEEGGGEILVGTVSHCHGAVSRLVVGAPTANA